MAIWQDIRLRDVAAKVGITERAVQRIVADLESAGYLGRERVGRQNQYRLQTAMTLRHPLEEHVEVGRLLAVLMPEGNPQAVTGAGTRPQKTAVRRKRKTTRK